MTKRDDHDRGSSGAPVQPLVAAAEMGYGHLRAAHAVADALGEPVVHVDRAPVAGPVEAQVWGRLRDAYEATSRLSQLRGVGSPIRWCLDELTSIPHLHPSRDLSAATMGTLVLDRLIAVGLGRGLAEHLHLSGRRLVTTFYAPAIAADACRCAEVFCVVTDTDVNRVWVPRDARQTRIRYLVPTERAARRLRLYGVPPELVAFTGFPLPDELVGGLGLVRLRQNLASRLVRLDPSRNFRREHGEELAHFLGTVDPAQADAPPLLTFAVGGAGAQVELVRSFLPAMRPAIEDGRLRVALVAGTKARAHGIFADAIHGSLLDDAVGAGIEILFDTAFEQYLRRMNELLGRTDVLWTKPSEMCFYAALGLPLICASPVGSHERMNRRWIREQGAGIKQRDPRFAAEWLADMLTDGSLAAAAWAGFARLPKFGLYRVLRAIGGDPSRDAGSVADGVEP